MFGAGGPKTHIAMKENNFKDTGKSMISLGAGLFAGIALVYTVEEYGILVASSCLASLLLIVGIILIKLDKKNTDS